MTLFEVARDISRRLAGIFVRDATGRRPVYGGAAKWRDLVLFYEYFHGDNGAGLGASHQTGWTVQAGDMLATPKQKLEARLVREQVHGA